MPRTITTPSTEGVSEGTLEQQAHNRTDSQPRQLQCRSRSSTRGDLPLEGLTKRNSPHPESSGLQLMFRGDALKVARAISKVRLGGDRFA